jgi:phage terminase large subunit GpA-like protein
MRTTKSYDSLNAMGVALADMLRPPERMSISEASEKYVHLNIPGAYVGPYQNDMTPYMVEPMDTLKSRLFNGVAFCGPAQSGKTQSLILNWLAYSVVVDPMDMIVYSPSHAAARDFAVRRVDRMHRHSPAVGRMLSPRADDDNRHDKIYRNGMMLSLSWPSVTEFAGKPIGRAALTDFDRMDDDIDGDGNPFDLASKRTTTFGSFAMTLAESSPSRPLEDPRWIQETPHQAPPVKGILSIYNRGDRRRWYWPCMRCDHYFEGNFRMIRWADGAENSHDRMEAAESAFMLCPKCGFHNLPAMRRDMNEAGVWLKDGQKIDERGRITGKAARSDIASFWLNGVAATFISWQKLVMNFLAAQEDYNRTGSEESLKKFTNTDLAEPYTPKHQADIRTPDVLKGRAEPYGQAGTPEVPQAVRALLAAVDVQGNKFVVQVFGVAPGKPFDLYVIDRFDIQKSLRTDADGDHYWVRPGSYLEDWNLLKDGVILKTYPIAGTEGRRMAVRLTVCDSGGREGVTTNAYAFYREIRRAGLSSRFHLLKGEPSAFAPRTQIRYPDSSTRATGPKAGAQGDIPVLFINSTIGKDTLNNRLDSTEPGKGMIHFPNWFEEEFFSEMCSEVRTPKGWEKSKGGRSRNEAWDLSYYAIAACSSPLMNVEKLDWTASVPPWADVYDRNPFVSGVLKQDVASKPATRYKMADLGAVLG